MFWLLAEEYGRERLLIWPEARVVDAREVERTEFDLPAWLLRGPAIHQPLGDNVLNAGTLVPVTKNILSEIITRQANDATIK